MYKPGTEGFYTTDQRPKRCRISQTQIRINEGMVGTKSLDRRTCNRLVSALLIVIGSLAGGHGLWHPLESAVVGTPLLCVTAPSILHIRHRSSSLSASASVSLALVSLSVSQAPPKSCATVLSSNYTTVSPSNVGNLKTSTKQSKSKSKRQESAGKPTHVLGTTSEVAHRTGLAVASPPRRSMESLNLEQGWISEIYGPMNAARLLLTDLSNL